MTTLPSGLVRQIRAAAATELPEHTTYGARAIRDFARDLETWIPEIAEPTAEQVDQVTAELEQLRARVAELEAERHQANEWLEDAAKALRAKDERIAELERQRDTVRGEVAEAVMCPDGECLNRHHLPKVVGLLGGVGLVDAPEAGEPRG